MNKRTVIHKEQLNLKVKIKKSDFAGFIYKDKNTYKEYVLAGTLLKSKNGKDLREVEDFVVPLSTTGTAADAILTHDVELKIYNEETNETATATLEGIAYLDTINDVYGDLPTSLTVTSAELPKGMGYLYKSR